MFDFIPTEIKKMIFARVRLMDLHEVSSVSTEWWTLAMATCSTTSDEYSDFLDFQVNFCNEMMPKEEGWQWWMFIEFTDDKTIKIFDAPNEKVMEYLRQKGIQVRKLIYDGDPLILPNLKKLFPHLQTLNVTLGSYEHDGEAVVLPDGLKHLCLILWNDNPIHLTDLFKHLERLDDLYIGNDQRILFGNISFDNLKKLNLDMSNQSAGDIKTLVAGSKQLSIVHLSSGWIDKEWLGLFPTSIKKIYLNNFRLQESFVSFLGYEDEFLGRQVMRFICQDWTKILLFKSTGGYHSKHHKHDYVCRPQVLEDEIKITMFENDAPSGLMDSGQMQLKVLKLEEPLDRKHILDLIVPKSVQHFEWVASQLVAIDFGALFEDISTIKTVRIDSPRYKHIKFCELPYAASLVSLHISGVDDIFLASILRKCPSLKQLSLDCPQGMPFRKLPAELKSPPVEQLSIMEPEDSITDILKYFPGLVDLRLESVNMKTVTIPDLDQLTSLEFVQMSFQNVNTLVALIPVVNCLNHLSFSHLMLGYSFGQETLSCVMGREKEFFRRYSASDFANDFTQMNIRQISDFFPYKSIVYVKGVSSLHLISSENDFQITHDSQEFIGKLC